MKIAFSTLACHDYSFSEIYSMATDLGFDGIEVRGLGLDIFDGKTMPFSKNQLPQTLQKLRSLKLEISCLSSGCCLKDADKAEENINEIKKYIELANAMDVRYVRVLGDLNPAPCTEEVDDNIVYLTLNALIPYAEQKGVTLLVETNGVYSNTERLKALLDRFKSDAVAALWDFHHPYRYAGESPEKTIQNLGMYIRYVHVKDSVIENGNIKYRLMGEGDLPISEMLLALRSIDYSGYITLEWVKRWAPDLEDAGIVFPQFVNYMAQFIGKGKSNGALHTNLRGDGQYIWEKNRLIDITFPQLLDRVCDVFPNQYAIKYTTCDYTRTYAQFREDVDQFARVLISLGVKRGDHVAIWATNVPQWFITFWAATKIGAVLVTVNTS